MELDKVLVPEDVISLKIYHSELDALRDKLTDIERHLLSPNERGAVDTLMKALQRRIDTIHEHDRIMRDFSKRLIAAEKTNERIKTRLKECLASTEAYDECDSVDTMLEKVLCAPVPLGFMKANSSFSSIATRYVGLSIDCNSRK